MSKNSKEKELQDAIEKELQDAIENLVEVVVKYGLTQGLVEVKKKPLTDCEIDAIGENMPNGLQGFLTDWGWRQFARAIERHHNIES